MEVELMRAIKTISLYGFVTVLVLTLGGCAAQSDDDVEVAGEEGGGLFDFLEGSETYEVPAGTALTFAIAETLSTSSNESGDPFTATLSAPLVVDGRELIPSGARATGRVTEATESGRVRGRASIQLVIEEIEHGGEIYELSTDAYHAVAEATKGEDAATIGAGAGIGAAVGAVLGGGDGAAQGAAIGGGGGTAVVLATRGDEIEIAAGSRIPFVLNEAVSVTF
jgi:hypothetical protein